MGDSLVAKSKRDSSPYHLATAYDLAAPPSLKFCLPCFYLTLPILSSSELSWPSWQRSLTLPAPWTLFLPRDLLLVLSTSPVNTIWPGHTYQHISLSWAPKPPVQLPTRHFHHGRTISTIMHPVNSTDDFPPLNQLPFPCSLIFLNI